MCTYCVHMYIRPPNRHTITPRTSNARWRGVCVPNANATIYRRAAASSSTHNINLFIMYINELRARACASINTYTYSRRLTMGGRTRRRRRRQKISMRNTKRASHTNNATPLHDLFLAPFMTCHCNAHAAAHTRTYAIRSTFGAATITTVPSRPSHVSPLRQYMPTIVYARGNFR